jgi:hypothetical protein
VDAGGFQWSNQAANATWMALTASGLAWGGGATIASSTNVAQTSQLPVSGSGTFTAATSDAITVTGATASSHCSFSATNATAGTNLGTTYISGKAANTVTITHVTGDSGGTVDVVCTVN